MARVKRAPAWPTQQTTFRLPPELILFLDEFGAEESRNRSGQLVFELRRCAERRGYDLEDARRRLEAMANGDEAPVKPEREAQGGPVYLTMAHALSAPQVEILDVLRKAEGPLRVTTLDEHIPALSRSALVRELNELREKGLVRRKKGEASSRGRKPMFWRLVLQGEEFEE